MSAKKQQIEPLYIYTYIHHIISTVEYIYVYYIYTYPFAYPMIYALKYNFLLRKSPQNMVV